ncbi:MAG: peptidase M55 [Clostridiales bacterium]|nr:peptidase M55 [Clostridiales bacterium]
MKKYYVAVDLEGLACVVGERGEGLGNGAQYAFAAKEGVKEANACAQALFDMGADEVVIWDNHGSGLNMDYDQLDSRCKIAMGSGFNARFPGMDESYAGILFIGYHAKEATRNAVLAHTYSSKVFQGYTLNGKNVGEMEIDAAFAAEWGVKVLFAASDAAGIAQAKESFPWAETVETKQGYGWNGAVSLHPKEAQRQIYEAVKRAVERENEMKPYKLEGPLQAEIRFKRMDAANAAQLYDIHRQPFAFKDAFTRTGTIASVRQLFD